MSYTNFSLKFAVRSIETTSFQTILLGLVKSPFTWLGFIGAATLLLSFMGAIRTLPLSSAYAVLTALAIATITTIEWWFQAEPMSTVKIAGLLLAVTGVAMIASGA